MDSVTMVAPQTSTWVSDSVVFEVEAEDVVMGKTLTNVRSFACLGSYLHHPMR